MSINSINQNLNWPYGAVAEVVNGQTNALTYTYPGTLEAGNYVFSGVSLNDKASSLVLSSASNNLTVRIKSKETEYFTLPANASDVVFESEGALPTGETNVIGRYPSTQIYTVAYGNNKYVIFGGTVTTNAYVSDGINGAYTPYNTGINGSSFATSGFGNGKFVLFGTSTVNGGVSSSTDGITWTSSGFGRGFTWNQVKYLNNLWIAVGNRASVATSTDAVTWNWISGAMPSTGSVWSMTTGPSFALAGTNSAYVNISTTGIGWDLAYVNTSNQVVRSVVYANSLYIAAGGTGTLSTSTDGRNWTARTSGFGSTQINEVNYGASTWVAVGVSGQLRTSTDAITWTTRTSNFGTTDIYSVAYGNGIWVAAGSTGVMKSSTDAVTWDAVTSGFGTSQINKVKYLNNLWLAVGASGKLSTSTDAATWTTRTANFGTSTIYDIAYFNNYYIIVGNGATIRYSTDAITWSTTTWDTQPSSILYSVTEENGRLFAAGATGYVYSSTDGITWSQFYNTYAGANSINSTGVDYISGIYAVSSSSSTNTTSTDGITWTRNTASTSLQDIVSNGTSFVAVNSGIFYSSTDGTTFTQLADTSVSNLANLLYSDSQYLAYGALGAIYTSNNAISWTSRTYLTTTGTINEMVRGGGTQYVAVDNENSNVAWSTSITANIWRRAGIGQSSASAVCSNSNYIVAAGGDNILYAPTTTPTVWTQIVNTSTTSVYAAAASPTSYMLATDSDLLYSSNTTTWSTNTAGAHNDVIYDSFSNVFLAASGASAELIAYVTPAGGANPVTLTGFDLSPLITKIAAYNGWYLFGANNGQVAIGRGYKNTNDLIYQTLAPGDSIVGVAIGDDCAVAVTQYNEIYYCPLAELSDQALLSITTLSSTYSVTQNWQLANVPVITRTYTPVGLKYVNGAFVALMDNGVMWSSTDGANWSNLSINQPTDMGLYTGISTYGTDQFYLNTNGTVSQTTGGSLPSAFNLYKVSLPSL